MDKLALHMLIHDLRHAVSDVRISLGQAPRCVVGNTAQNPHLAAALIGINSIESLIKRLAVADCGRAVVSDELVDIDKLISEQARIFRPLCEHRQITLTRRSSPQLYVKGNAEDIARAVRNLLQNAVEAMPDGSRLTISTYVQRRFLRRRARIRVHNTGTYIPPEFRTGIFAPYFKNAGGGEGLGLAIVKAIAEKYAGSVECWSDRYSGTEFVLDFPAITLSSATATSSARAPIVIIVDDDVFVRDAWQRLDGTMPIETYASPAEFWRKYRRKILRHSSRLIIVTDYFFSGNGTTETGATFATQVRRRYPAARLILASAIGDLVSERRLFDDIIEKTMQPGVTLLQTLLRD